MLASDLVYRPSHGLWCPHSLRLPATWFHLLTLLPVSVLTHINVSTRDKKLENMVRLHAYMCRYPQDVSGGHVHKRICGYENSLLRSPLFQSQHWVGSRMAMSWSHHSLPSQMRECASNPGVRRSLRHQEEQERRSGSHDLHPP